MNKDEIKTLILHHEHLFNQTSHDLTYLNEILKEKLEIIEDEMNELSSLQEKISKLIAKTR